MARLDIENVKKLHADLYPVVTGLRCVEVKIPDDDTYLHALAGFIAVLGKSWAFQGDEADRFERAALWQQAYSETTWENCMDCEGIAQCIIDENPALIEALANAIALNETLRNAISQAITSGGGGLPGQPLSQSQREESLLPGNVRDEFGDCIDDNLWGAMLYLVQSANRVIVDFFDVLLLASTTLQKMGEVTKAMPAVNKYIGLAENFTDKLYDVLAPAYNAAYTEAYEQSLACDLFCIARDSCALTPTQIMTVINDRFTSSISIDDFGEIMLGIASGTWVGDEVADAMMMTYFGAMTFGQQFMDVIGIRPLTDVMSLGADQLASDNWETLCDCETITYGIPVILDAWTGFEVGGTNIVSEGGGYFTIDSTVTTPTGFDAITIKDATDRIFQLSDFSYPEGLNASVHIYQDPTGTDVNPGATTGVTTPCQKYGWFWGGGAPTPDKVRFKMIIP